MTADELDAMEARAAAAAPGPVPERDLELIWTLLPAMWSSPAPSRSRWATPFESSALPHRQTAHRTKS